MLSLGAKTTFWGALPLPRPPQEVFQLLWLYIKKKKKKKKIRYIGRIKI
jgi:hypothetical protein